jgi:2-polyprenyl-6-methoxyphenol hydroxylase-like FAD-dependent oxidoreductase
MGPTAPGGMTLTCDPAITAGGIGGLTLASSLAQRPVSVFEHDNELRQIGAGAVCSAFE